MGPGAGVTLRQWDDSDQGLRRTLGMRIGIGPHRSDPHGWETPMDVQRKMPILPVEAYTSQEWFDREQEAIFSRTWAFAGLAGDISEPGQYTSVQAGLNNIFIVMGRDRRLRAFHNICRHRGTQLLRAVGNTQRAIVCPYHDWTYDLEGSLISVHNREREFPGLDMACFGLKKASVDLWRGMLWVHPNEHAGSIMDWFGEVEPHLGPHDVDRLVEYAKGRSEYEIAANWKIVVENYIDGYHLGYLHSGTLAVPLWKLWRSLPLVG
ncbi:MAG: aromatic ring-hydroxylating dioxygenase subunit alpha [bacterium]|nr:aromatic ring-hydroxylating dioxygenase subunit alpha [bacterium]